MVTRADFPNDDPLTAPLVSIVMPMRNAAPYVQQALSSVLLETGVALEVLVVDDGSTDLSRAIVEGVGDARVRVLEGPCRGAAASINTGLQAARGEFVMRCDADDLYPPGRIRQQLHWLQTHPDHDAVCGPFSTMDAGGHPVADFSASADTLTAEQFCAELRSGKVRTSLCTYAIRRAALAAVGLHREYFETSSDIDLQLRLGEACRIAHLSQNTYVYRLHDTSITHTQGNLRRVFYEEATRTFQKQRLATGTDDLATGQPPVPPGREGDAPNKAALHVQGMLLGEAWRRLAKGERRGAVEMAWRAVVANPASVGTWKSAAKLGLRLLSKPAHRNHS